MVWDSGRAEERFLLAALVEMTGGVPVHTNRDGGAHMLMNLGRQWSRENAPLP